MRVRAETMDRAAILMAEKSRSDTVTEVDGWGGTLSGVLAGSTDSFVARLPHHNQKPMSRARTPGIGTGPSFFTPA